MTYPDALEVVPAGPVDMTLAAPASKSVTNRLLIVATLAAGQSTLHGPLVSDDSAAMRRVVTGLGAEVKADGATWRVIGTGGALAAPAKALHAGLSGTTLRFGLALAALAPGPVTLAGGAALLRRPLGPLARALGELGTGRISVHVDRVRVAGGGLRGGRVGVDVTSSSQFASAVLLVAPYAAADVTVVAEGATAHDYLDLTVATMRGWGAEVADEGASAWRVRAGRPYAPREAVVAYDASAAAHLHALAAATGGRVTVTNAAQGSGQPDADLPAVLAQMGATVERHGDALTVTGPARLAPIDVDLRRTPDQVTTVAALAALAPGTSHLRGVAVARSHETDRLAALRTELGRLSVEVEEHPDGLTIHGGTARGPARLATHDDHRLAMAFASIGAAVPGVVIAEPGCVAKTYPGFWAELAAQGLTWRAA